MTQLSVAPFMAPLSEPMMLQALSAQGQEHTKTAMRRLFTTTLQEQLSQTEQEFTRQWALLIQRNQEQRTRVYTLMTPVVRKHALTTEWIIEKLTEFTPKRTAKRTPISAETISRWREQGLIRYQEKNRPNAQSAAALLTLRLLIQQKERRWTPSAISQSEPLWWCWRQDSPQAPIIPCPIPLPEDLPHTALLWTTWLGASWDPAWLQLGNKGCARWAGTIQEHDQLLWRMSEEDLQQWDKEIAPLGNNVLDTAAPLTRHTLATLALLRLVTPRLVASQTFPSSLAETSHV